MDEFRLKSTTTYGSFGLLKQSFLNYGGLTGFRQLQSFTKVMAFAKIPLMTENHSRYKANKDKRQGEVIIYRSYSSKYHIPSSINRDDFNNHPEKPRTIGGLRLQGCRSYDKPNVGEAAL
jgi:iron complex outermembrane receptor protein